MNPDLEQPQPESNSNKTVIILLVLIILSGIVLGVMIVMQQPKSETTNSTSNTGGEIISPEDQVITAEKAATITITQNQIDEKVSQGICWTISEGIVYDVSDYIQRLPEDQKVSEEEICGKDSTALLKSNESSPPVESFGLFNPYVLPVGVLGQ